MSDDRMRETHDTRDTRDSRGSLSRRDAIKLGLGAGALLSLTGTSVESEKPRLRSAYLFYRNKMDAALRNIDAAASGVRL